MHLITTDKNFKLANYAYPNFPILLDSEMKSVRPVNRFLVYKCIKSGRVQSKRSWQTYGQAFYDYFSFLETYKKEWTDIYYASEFSILAAYRDWAQKTGSSDTTINLRLRILIKFYDWAYVNGLISKIPYDFQSITVSRPKTFLSHSRIENTVKSPDVLLKEHQKPIKCLNKDQIKTLIRSIKNPTHEMMIKLGLVCGLRREEIYTLPASTIVNPRSHQEKLFVLEITGKGNKKRNIRIPKTLMQELWNYMVFERPKLLQDKDDLPGALFLSRYGKPFSDKSPAFNQALNNLKLNFKVTPHMLRHTCATLWLGLLIFLKSEGKFVGNELIYVRNLLGHSSLTTTEKYLHYVDQVNNDILNEYWGYLSDFGDDTYEKNI